MGSHSLFCSILHISQLYPPASIGLSLPVVAILITCPTWYNIVVQNDKMSLLS